MTKILGRPSAEPTPSGELQNPWAAEEADTLEKNQERTSQTDSGLGLNRGKLGLIRGAWARLGFQMRFRVRRR